MLTPTDRYRLERQLLSTAHEVAYRSGIPLDLVLAWLCQTWAPSDGNGLLHAARKCMSDTLRLSEQLDRGLDLEGLLQGVLQQLHDEAQG